LVVAFAVLISSLVHLFICCFILTQMVSFYNMLSDINFRFP